MKKQRIDSNGRSDLFDRLPDDLVISILCKLSSTALSPSDFITVLVTCKRLNRLGLDPVVLKQAGSKALAVRAKNWSESAHQFLYKCVIFGNVEACYILGMIRFYCLQNRPGGVSLIAKAAIKSHTSALYSLGVIQFNGSGVAKCNKDLHAGVLFFARAASFGHTDSIRELGHCFQDGYGVTCNVEKGRHLILRAHLQDIVACIRALPNLKSKSVCGWLLQKRLNRPKTEQFFVPSLSRKDKLLLLRECQMAVREQHPANKFLLEWFESREIGPGLRMCSCAGCGRPETRANEYRRCSACGKANYCSRGCQAQDWKARHKVDCTLLEIDGGDEADDVEIDDLVAVATDLIAGPS